MAAPTYIQRVEKTSLCDGGQRGEHTFFDRLIYYVRFKRLAICRTSQQ